MVLTTILIRTIFIILDMVMVIQIYMVMVAMITLLADTGCLFP